MAALISELEADGLIMPQYNKSNLELSKQFFLNGKGSLIGDKEKKIFLLLDGFGYNIIEDIIKKEKVSSKLFEDSRIEKITSLFPSTTPNVLTSLYSGLLPVEHGVLGTMMLLKEIGSIKKIMGPSVSSKFLQLEFGDLEPSIIFPGPRLIEESKKKYKCIFLYPENIARGKLTKAMIGNVADEFHASFEDMLVHLGKIIEDDKYDRIFVYFDNTDHMQHVYSHDSPEFEHFIRSLLHALDVQLLPKLRESNYNLIISSDHGHIPIHKKSVILWDYNSKIMDYLVTPPWNESRLRIFDVIPKREKAFQDYFEKEYGKFGRLVESDEALDAGLFGAKKVEPKLRSRFGTYLLVPKADYYFDYRYPGSEKHYRDLFGHHGSLSPDEMQIPAVIY